MSERIMGNINLFKLVRAKYKSKEGFNVYHTSRHSEQSQFPNQLKGAWFCSRNNFFSDKSRPEIPCIPLDKKGQSEGKLSSKFISVLDKGIKQFQDDFKTKLFACFPDLRYKMLAM